MAWIMIRRRTPRHGEGFVVNVAQEVVIAVRGGGGGGGASAVWPAREGARVTDARLAAVEGERGLVLPHEDVSDMRWQKGSDRDRWLRGTRRHQSFRAAQA